MGSGMSYRGKIINFLDIENMFKKIILSLLIVLTLNTLVSATPLGGTNNVEVFPGRVAAGTKNTPASILHVYESTPNVGVTAGLTVENQGIGDAILQFLITSVRRWVIGIDQSDANKFKIGHQADLSTAADLTIDTAGQVGIGTTTPARTLHVGGTNGMRLTPSALPGTPAAGDMAIDSADTNRLKWYNGTAWQSAGGSGAGTPGGVSGSVQFNNGGTFGGSNTFLYDNANSRLGLGGSPTTNVHIYENNTDTSPAWLLEQGGTGDAAQRYYLTGGQNVAQGIHNADNDNYKICNAATLTGTTYSDANTLQRIHTETGSEGITDLNHQSRARAYLSVAQSIPNASWTQIDFDAENFDEHNEWDDTTNYRFTAKEDGYYQVNARTRFTITAATANNYVSIALYVNGSVYAYGNNLAVGTSSSNTDIFSNNAPIVSDVVYLTAGQYLEVYAYQNSGGARNINSGSAETYVSIHKVS